MGERGVETRVTRDGRFLPPALLWLTCTNPDVLRRSSQRMGGLAPEWVQIFPYPTYVGEVDGERVEWITDEISQESCVDFFNLRGNDLVIDYEHLSDKDREAPAAGRIVELRAGGKRGLLARAEWTERARRQIESGEYYYDSPSFFWSRKDKRIYGLRHVALTNNPGSWGRPYITDHSATDYGIERTAQTRGSDVQSLELVCAVQTNTGRRKGMAENKTLESLRSMLQSSGKVTGKELRADIAKLMDAIPDNDEPVIAPGDGGTETTTVLQLVIEGTPLANDDKAQIGTAAQKAAVTPIRLALGVETDDPRELALAVMNLKASSVSADRLRELETRLAAAEARSGDERIAIEIARQRAAGKQITPAFEAELIRVAKRDVDLALSSLTGLQMTTLDLRTQADTPAPTVDRLETARQRADVRTTELPANATPALKASVSAHEDTLAIAREKGIGYTEANQLRLDASRAATAQQLAAAA